MQEATQSISSGVVYGIILVQRARGQVRYRPVFEDWLWHVVLPLIAYTSLLIAAVALTRYPRQALFVIGGTTLLLLFDGIHNAWDTVTYITIEFPATQEDQSQQEH